MKMLNAFVTLAILLGVCVEGFRCPAGRCVSFASLKANSNFRLYGKKGGKGKKGGSPPVAASTTAAAVKIQPAPAPPLPPSVPTPPTTALLEPETDYTKGMPDRSAFVKYYDSKVAAGSEMSFEQILAYPPVVSLLEQKVVYKEDIEGLWASAVGDAQGLNAQEGYDMLCMISDLPEPESAEDAAYLDTEFKKLVGAKGGNTLPFFKFLNWDEIQAMMNDGVLTMEEVSQQWRDVAGGDLNAPIDRATFGLLNFKIDDAIDAKETDSAAAGQGDDDGEIDLTGVDVWSPDFDPSEVFEPETLEEITSFFIKASPRGQLTFEKLLEWGDLAEMYAEGLTPAALRVLWDQACGSGGASTINLDSFLRFNVALDLLLDEIEEAGGPKKSSGSGSDSDNGIEFYRTEFKQVTQGGRLMRLDMLLEWSEMQDLMADGVITEKQVEKMWNTLPQEPMGIPATTSGINIETFVAFNTMLDSMLDVTGSGTASSSSSSSSSSASAPPTQAITPQLLVSEPARPMPKMSEMKIGELASQEAASGTEASTGLSESELELMQVLDKADNMLNSGSFGDFDQLIGDMNDPRLQALRAERDGADEVRGQLNDVLKELLQLSRAQQRCGLDRPDEETAARIRDLIQAVIEKAPRAAQRDINEIRKAVNGNWKLLYTNSEMFSFYNGVTGFANVFPASKFADLRTQYSSDGYLSESRYFERLTTPMGNVDATVFSTWEIVKEMSFMTNDNSVVLRNYCTKVIAGPMEYEAQENWKSLRTMSMNELVYVDENIKIMRNSGALRIFFVYERE